MSILENIIKLKDFLLLCKCKLFGMNFGEMKMKLNNLCMGDECEAKDLGKSIQAR